MASNSFADTTRSLTRSSSRNDMCLFAKGRVEEIAEKCTFRDEHTRCRVIVGVNRYFGETRARPIPVLRPRRRRGYV